MTTEASISRAIQQISDRIPDIDEALTALCTQYQFRSEAIIPRSCQDAPTVDQIGLIRQVHISVYSLLLMYKVLLKENEILINMYNTLATENEALHNER